MENKNYNCRVVHTPLKDTYVVDVKEKWWKRWEYVTSYSYYRSSTRKGHYDALYSREEALSAALCRAQELMAETIVFDGRAK